MKTRWGILALVFIGMLISYLDRGNLGIAAPAIMRDFHLPPGAMGVLLSAFFWTYGFAQIPAGILVDRFGIKFTYAAAFLIWSLSSAGIALTQGFVGIIALRLLLGLAESVGPIASLAFVRNSFSPHEHGLPTAIYIAAQNIGPALGTLVGSLLLADYGWRVMFAVTGLVALLWLPGWLYTVPRNQNRTRTTKEPPRDQSPWNWAALSTNPSLWIMCLCIFLFSYYWYFVLTWMPVYLISAKGYSTIEMGRILSLSLFGMACVNIIGGRIADGLVARSNSIYLARVIFAAGGFLGSGAILLLLVVPGRSATLPILVFSLCCGGLGSSNYWAIAQRLAPGSKVGRWLAYLNTLSQLGGVVAPLITGWTLGNGKQFGPAISLAGLFPIVACFLLLAAGAPGLLRLSAIFDPDSEANS